MNHTDNEPRSEDDILIACALRFDGYKYVTNRKFDHIAAFQTLKQTGDLAPFERLQHLTLFFMLQRYLYKWGGDMLSPRSPEWRTFRELFFLCCRAKIPKSYRFEPHCTKWERTYAPQIDEWIALVRRTHQSIDYLPKTALDPSIKGPPGVDSDSALAYQEKLGLSDTDRRPFEEQATNVLRFFPEATIARTRDAIQLNVHSERGIVLLLTPEALEVRLPTVEWTHGAYGPAASSTLWQRVLWESISTADVYALCMDALSVREKQFVPCRFCGREFPPEHRHDDVCHGCAERELGIVH